MKTVTLDANEPASYGIAPRAAVRLPGWVWAAVALVVLLTVAVAVLNATQGYGYPNSSTETSL